MSNFYDRFKRNDKSKQFYSSKEWKKMRAYIFKRDMGLCQMCLEKGEIEIVNGDVVHHKIELLDGEKGWRLRLDPENLITICHQCHNNIHKGNDEPVLRYDVMFDDEGNLVRKE